MSKLREGAGGWVAKTLLGMLIVAFGIWGIADVFRGFGAQDAAVVGSTKIGVEEFRRIYTERLQLLSRQLNRGLTPEQARTLGFDRQILGELISEAAFDEKARRLGLNLDNAALARHIQTNPAFRGPGGTFDPAYFEQVLRANGLNEARFIDAERRLLLRQQIARALGGEITTPAVLRDAIDRYEREERAAEFVTLGRSDVGEIADPTPEQLAAFFNANKAMFRAPEFRKISILALSPETLLPWVQISEDEVRKAYEARKDRFETPEKREIEQIVFANLDEAKAAAERIKAGEKFEAIVAERKLDKKDVALGLIARRELLDPAVAEAAFALAASTVGGPVSGRFGPAIVRVLKIEPGKVSPFAEVEPLIRRELAIDRARRNMLDLHDKIEDERAAGSNLIETAKKLGLIATTIDAVDRSGRDPESTLLDTLPARDQLLAGAFAAKKNVETDPIELRVPGGIAGYIWYEVLDIIESKERTLEESKAQVEARWREDQIGRKLAERAGEIRLKLDAGGTFAIAAPGLKVESRDKLKRGRTVDGLDARVVTSVFETPQGKNGIGVAEDGLTRAVFRVTAVTLPPDPAPKDSQVAALLRGIEDDLVTQYLYRLQSDLGVRINDAAVRQVTGGERN